jgi:hypothetical protein
MWINKKREDADFCHIAPCRLVQAVGRFKDAYCLYHQDEDYNFHVRFKVLTAASMMFTSETSVDNHFTRQYIPEDNSENYNFHTRGHENLKTRQQQKHLHIEQYLLLTLGWLPFINHGFKQLCKIESFNINSSVY